MTCKHDSVIEYKRTSVDGAIRWRKKWCNGCGQDLIGPKETPAYTVWAVFFAVITLLCAAIEAWFGVGFGFGMMLWLAMRAKSYRYDQTEPIAVTAQVTESGAWIDDLIDDLERCGPRAHTAPRSEQ